MRTKATERPKSALIPRIGREKYGLNAYFRL